MSDIHDPAQPETPSASDGPGTPAEPTQQPAEAAAQETRTETPAADAAPPAEAAPSAEGASASDDGSATESDGEGVAEGEGTAEGEGAPGEGAQGEGAPGEGAQGGKRKRRRRGKGGGEQGAAAQGGGQQGAPRPDADSNRRAFHVGDKVRARILKVGPAAVLVDLWGKEQGVLDLQELLGEGKEEPKEGDAVEVIVTQDGSRGGEVVVTTNLDRAKVAREVLEKALASGEPVEGLVTGLNRGGLEVDIHGARAFCPSSQLDLRFPPTVNPRSLVLTRQLFKVTSVSDGRGDDRAVEAVVSRRALLEKQLWDRLDELREAMKPGTVVKGTVVAIKEYGVFVDLGGLEGLIHITELTHNRSARPSDVVKLGQEVEAKVIRISNAQRPQATGAPEAATSAEAPAAPEAPAAEAAPEGAEGGDKGDKGGRDKRDRRGGRPQQQNEHLPRVMLSRRAVEPDPWDGVEKRYAPGSVHTGKVARMQPFGAFVELEPGIDGLVHVSELGQGKRIDHPEQVLQLGQSLTLRVEKVDRREHRISLVPVPEGTSAEDLKKSVAVRLHLVAKAKVVEHEERGFWAQIEGALGKNGRGFVSARDSNQPRGTDLRKALPVGTEIMVKVIEMDRGRPGLSIRAALQDEERQAYRAYQREASAKTVGTSLRDKLARLTGAGSDNK